MPPLVGVAVNITEVPEQIAPAGEAEILTLAGKFGLTVIVTVFDIAGLAVKQGVAFEVITQVTTSPLANAAFV